MAVSIYTFFRPCYLALSFELWRALILPAFALFLVAQSVPAYEAKHVDQIDFTDFFFHLAYPMYYRYKILKGPIFYTFSDV